jgi:HEAT repeat protein
MPLFEPPNVEKLKARRDVNGLIKALKYQGPPDFLQNIFPRMLLYHLASDKVHKDAAETLGELKDARAVKPLAAAARKDIDPEMRVIAIRALVKIGNARAVKPLIVALKDGAPSVYEAAAAALGQIGDAHAVKPLILAESEQIASNKFSRGYSAAALLKIGAPAVEQLIVALKNRDAYVRMVAATALGDIRDARALNPLLITLKDTDEEVRRRAADALGQLGDILAVEPLVDALGDDDVKVRTQAALALGIIGDDRAVEPLIDALGDEDVNVCVQAALALGKIGDAGAVEPLIDLLNDDDPDVRGNSAEALGGLRDYHALRPLVVALKDDDQMVRRRAVNSLEKLGFRPQEANEVGIAYWIAEQDWEKCIEVGAPAVESLIALLQDENADIQINAIETLGAIGNAGAVKALIAILKDDSYKFKDSARSALVSLYKSRKLDAKSKKLILAHQGEITITSHDDRYCGDHIEGSHRDEAVTLFDF